MGVALDLGVVESFAPSLEMPCVQGLFSTVTNTLLFATADKIFQRDFVLLCFVLLF